MRETSCLQLGQFCSVHVVSMQVMLFVLRAMLHVNCVTCYRLASVRFSTKFESDIDGELPLNLGDVIVTTAWDQ